MTIFTFANNVNTTLAGAISASSTSITLASNIGLPLSIPLGQSLAITLNDAATRQNFEIVYATAVTGSTLTVVRAQEGTAALSWLVGDFVYSAPTAGQMANEGQIGANNTWTGNNTFTQPLAVGNSTSSGQAITQGQANSTFAQLSGSSSQVFNVATAVTNNEAMPLGQLPSQFASLLAGNGYKKIPDPNSPTGFYIEQWGNTAIQGNGNITTVSLPLAYSNVVYAPIACYSTGSIPSGAGSLGAGIGSLSTLQFQSTHTGGGGNIWGIYWHVRGY
jgi:hypothetical protein